MRSFVLAYVDAGSLVRKPNHFGAIHLTGVE